MVTPIGKESFEGNVLSAYVCLSTDTLPATGNGSVAIEMDTGDKFIYDEEGASWRNIADGSVR